MDWELPHLDLTVIAKPCRFNPLYRVVCSQAILRGNLFDSAACKYVKVDQRR